MDLVFEWDSQKAKRNLRKHGITFDEAITVFDDTLAAIFPDDDHSGSEDRAIIVGVLDLESATGRVLHGTIESPGANYQRSESDCSGAK